MQTTDATDARQAVTASDSQEGGPVTDERPTSAAWRVAVGYLVVASAWIVLSDSAVSLLPHAWQDAAQSFKGLLFVAVTSAALYLITRAGVRRFTSQRAATERAQQYAQTIIESSPDAIVAFDESGVAVAVNAAAERVFGIGREVILGRSAADLADAQVDPGVARAILAGAAGEDMRDAEGLMCIKGGRRFWASASSAPLSESGGGVFVIADRSKEWRLERKAKRQADRLLDFDRRVAEAIEIDRQSMASGLHDGLAQTLAAAKLSVGLIGAATDDETRAATVDHVKHLLDNSIAATYALTYELFPPLLGYRGLGAALEWLVGRLDGDASCSWSFDGHDVEVDSATGAILYRVAAELARNVQKHSGAHNARIELTADDGVAVVTVSDDGVGFGRITNPEGTGLLAARLRLERSGGDLAVFSRQGDTSVVAQLPVGRD